jgi:hypothetical protein
MWEQRNVKLRRKGRDGESFFEGKGKDFKVIKDSQGIKRKCCGGDNYFFSLLKKK